MQDCLISERGYMFFIIIVLAIIGIASLVGSSFAAVGALVLIPILLFKILLIFAFFGFVSRACGRGRRWQGPRRRSRWDRGESQPEGPSEEDRFDDWHRTSHARDEVDGWVPEV